MQHGGRGNSTSEGSAALAWDIRNLRAFPLFKLLDTAGLQAVEDLLQAHTMQQGTTVFEQGDALSGMFFIVSGQMLASIDGKAVARLGPGDVVGTEVFHAAFKDFENGAKPATQAPALSSALAETECTVGYLSARDFVESGRLMKTILEASIAADGDSGDEGEQGGAAHQRKATDAESVQALEEKRDELMRQVEAARLFEMKEKLEEQMRSMQAKTLQKTGSPKSSANNLMALLAAQRQSGAGPPPLVKQGSGGLSRSNSHEKYLQELLTGNSDGPVQSSKNVFSPASAGSRSPMVGRVSGGGSSGFASPAQALAGLEQRKQDLLAHEKLRLELRLKQLQLQSQLQEQEVAAAEAARAEGELGHASPTTKAPQQGDTDGSNSPTPEGEQTQLEIKSVLHWTLHGAIPLPVKMPGASGDRAKWGPVWEQSNYFNHAVYHGNYSRRGIPIDTSGDGKVDSLAVDFSGDGRVDTIITDERAEQLALHKVESNQSLLDIVGDTMGGGGRAAGIRSPLGALVGAKKAVSPLQATGWKKARELMGFSQPHSSQAKRK